MSDAGADVIPGDHGSVCWGVERCWGTSTNFSAVAESTEIVVAPARECVVGFGGARMA